MEAIKRTQFRTKFATVMTPDSGDIIQKMQANQYTKKFGQYSTPGRISKLLVSSMRMPDPAIVLDLGSGRGSLSQAACQHWRGVQLITVDIDPTLESALDGFLTTLPRHCHIRGDGLMLNLREKLKLGNQLIGAALCNPPYVRVPRRRHLVKLLQQAELAHEIAENALVPAEALFLAQNLILLASGRQLGIVVPDGFVCGEQYASLRRSLCEMHSIEKVINLPTGAFARTEARAHLIIITKNGKQRPDIPIFQLDKSGRLSSPLLIGIDEAERRMDYQFFEEMSRTKERRISISLRDVPHSMTRGSFSSATVKKLGGIFHTTDFPNGEDVKLCSTTLVYPEIRKPIIAKPGDILLARVGRQLQSKVCIVTSGKAAISDCVFRLRVPQSIRPKVLKSLTSIRGRAFLRSASKGAGARYVSKVSLLDLPIR